MPGFGIGRGIGFSKSSRTDPDALAFFARQVAAGYTETEQRKIYWNNLFIYLKNTMGIDGVTSLWNSCDAIWVMCQGNKAAGMLNLKSASYALTIITDYGGSFVTDQGFQGNGTTFKMDTNFNPFDGGTYKFTENSNCFGVYTLSNVREARSLISSYDASANGYEIATATTGFSHKNGSTTTSASGNGWPDCAGGFASKRTGATAWRGTRGTRPRQAETAVVTTMPNQSFRLFARYNGSAYSIHSNALMAFAYVGSSNIDVQKLERGIIENYMIPIGAAITKRVIFDGNSYLAQQTMTFRVMDLLWTNGIKAVSLFKGVTGITAATMRTEAVTEIDPFVEDFYTDEAFVFFEAINILRGGSGTVATTVAEMTAYITERKAAGWGDYFILNTTMPFWSTNVQGIPPTRRENPADLNDVTTYNGYVRTNYLAMGAVRLANITDTGDALFPDSGGVAGVGEKNLTHYQVDEQHLTSTAGNGYNKFGEEYLYPQVLDLLT